MGDEAVQQLMGNESNQLMYELRRIQYGPMWSRTILDIIVKKCRAMNDCKLGNAKKTTETFLLSRNLKTIKNVLRLSKTI